MYNDSNKISSVDELLKNSFLIYKQGFTRFFGMSLILILVYLLFLAFRLLFVFLGDTSSGGFDARFELFLLEIFLGIPIIIAVTYAKLVVQAGIFIIIKNFHQKLTIAETIREARKYFWKFLVVFSLIALSILLGFSFLIIPGIILAVYHSLALWALMDDDYESTLALKRSRDLVKDNWWDTFGKLMIVMLIFLVPSIPLFFLQYNTYAYQIWDIFSSTINSILIPFAIIYTYLIYKDLVQVKKVKNIEK